MRKIACPKCEGSTYHDIIDGFLYCERCWDKNGATLKKAALLWKIEAELLWEMEELMKKSRRKEEKIKVLHAIINNNLTKPGYKKNAEKLLEFYT